MKYFKEIDLDNRDEMIDFLKNHFRYDTANSWNHSTSYANNMKINRLGFSDEIRTRLYAILDCENAYDRVNKIISDFGQKNDYIWQAGFNGRSGGYLVLYQGGWKYSEYKSFCTSCGQKNFTSVLDTGCKCGRCGRGTRLDFKIPLKEVFVYPGRSTDMGEDFEEWDMDQLRSRCRLVMEFDALCDSIVAEAMCLAENGSVEEEEYFVPHTRRILTVN